MSLKKKKDNNSSSKSIEEKKQSSNKKPDLESLDERSSEIFEEYKKAKEEEKEKSERGYTRHMVEDPLLGGIYGDLPESTKVKEHALKLAELGGVDIGEEAASLGVDENIKEKIIEAAKEEGRSMSQIIREGQIYGDEYVSDRIKEVFDELETLKPMEREATEEFIESEVYEPLMEEMEEEEEEELELGEWTDILREKYEDLEEGWEESLEEIEEVFRGYKPPSYKELGQMAREFQKARKIRYKPKEDLTKYQIPKGGYTPGALRKAYKEQKKWDINIKHDKRNNVLIISFRVDVEDLPRGIETVKVEFNKIARMMELIPTGRINIVSEPKVSGGIFMTRMTAPVKKRAGKELRRDL